MRLDSDEDEQSLILSQEVAIGTEFDLQGYPFTVFAYSEPEVHLGIMYVTGVAKLLDEDTYIGLYRIIGPSH
jgi:hypothetical protein